MARQPSRILSSAEAKVAKQQKKEEIKALTIDLKAKKAMYKSDTQALKAAQKQLDKTEREIEHLEKTIAAAKK
jgi:hypothetical protein